MKVMVIVKASEESERGDMPTSDELNEMGKYNEELVSALSSGRRCRGIHRIRCRAWLPGR